MADATNDHPKPNKPRKKPGPKRPLVIDTDKQLEALDRLLGADPEKERKETKKHWEK